MANVLQPIGTDASGYEVLTAAIQELLNQYPGLPQGERIKFEELEKDKGIAFSADSGAFLSWESFGYSVKRYSLSFNTTFSRQSHFPSPSRKL